MIFLKALSLKALRIETLSNALIVFLLAMNTFKVFNGVSIQSVYYMFDSRKMQGKENIKK